jgi:hypothetical protein
MWPVSWQNYSRDLMDMAYRNGYRKGGSRNRSPEGDHVENMSLLKDTIPGRSSGSGHGIGKLAICAGLP